MGLTCFIVPILLYAWFRWSGVPANLIDLSEAMLGKGYSDYFRFSDQFFSSYAIGAMVAVHFIGAHALAHRIGRTLARVEQPIRWLAQSTFTIYLLHYPLLRLIGAAVPYDRTSALAVAGVLAATLAICVAVGAVVEPRKTWWRDRLDRLVPDRARAARPLAPVPG
jgi:peptidoglycan/LPS O-acetylase OafA/YrhL